MPRRLTFVVVVGAIATAALVGHPPAHAAPGSRVLLGPEELARLGLIAATRSGRQSRGASVEALRVASAVSLVTAPSTCRLELGEIPLHRKETMSVAATIVLEAAGAKVRVSATATVRLPPEAVPPDVSRGAPIALHLTQGAIEITASAVAAADGDLGQIIPVLLRPSGRAARGMIVARGRAEWVTAP